MVSRKSNRFVRSYRLPVTPDADDLVLLRDLDRISDGVPWTVLMRIALRDFHLRCMLSGRVDVPDDLPVPKNCCR